MDNTIVFFNSFDYGSTGTLCNQLVAKAKANGFKTIFVSDNQKKSNKADYYVSDHCIKINRFLINMVRSKLGHSTIDFSNAITRKAIKYLESKIDFKNENVIFHFHNVQYMKISIFGIIRFAIEHNVKIVWTLHDCWAFTGGCNYFSFENCDLWKTSECNHCIKKFHLTSKEFRKKHTIFSNNKALFYFVSPSIWLDNLLSSSVTGVRHKVINNGIDTSFWDYQKRTYTHKIKLLAVAHPWDYRKGLDSLNQLTDILPPNYSLTVVGVSEENKTNKRIKRVGMVSKGELKKLYNRNDIFINPTLDDNFPTVNIEALLCGLPIVSYQTGGSCEIFDSKTGFVTSEKNSESLLNAIKKIKLSNELETECRLRGQTFSLEAFSNNYINLYNEILIGN